jgi:hypothetical protein
MGAGRNGWWARQNSTRSTIKQAVKVRPLWKIAALRLQAIATAKEQFKDETQLERLKKYHGNKARWVVDAWTETWLIPTPLHTDFSGLISANSSGVIHHPLQANPDSFDAWFTITFTAKETAEAGDEAHYGV